MSARQSVRKDSFARTRKQEVLASGNSSLRAPASRQSAPIGQARVYRFSKTMAGIS